MKAYHYATWRGVGAYLSGVLQPSDDYARIVKAMYGFKWPKLVFMTMDAFWEPTCMAKTEEGYFENCASDPMTYTELGIPCWRFTCIPRSIVPVQDMAQVCGPIWNDMVNESEKYNATSDRWVLSREPVKIIESKYFHNNSWRDLWTVFNA